MADSDVKTCANRGCGRQYAEADNDGLRQPCVYHWGKPFFHDAYKGWTCCQKKSTDFTTFLNFPGCKSGKHCSQPIVAEEVAQEALPAVPNPPKEEDNEEKNVLFEFREDVWNRLSLHETKAVANSDVTSGESNKMSGSRLQCRKCRKTVDRSDVTSGEKEECVYHKGQTIFHETLKYWTCCPQKKFTDFEDFQKLKGCAREEQHDLHVVLPKPRVDWFQTSQSITIIVYGVKGVRAHSGSYVTTNGRTVRALFCDAIGSELWSEEWLLCDYVMSDVTEAKVVLDLNKVEIVLPKVKAKSHWMSLCARNAK